jgi:hypothetical protein
MGELHVQLGYQSHDSSGFVMCGISAWSQWTLKWKMVTAWWSSFGLGNILSRNQFKANTFWCLFSSWTLNFTCELIPSDKHRSHGECHAPSGSKLSGAAAPESRTFHKIFAMNSTTDQEKV